MQQRLAVFMCFLIGLSVWLVFTNYQFSPIRPTSMNLTQTVAISDKKELTQTVQNKKQRTTPKRIITAQSLILEITRLKIKLELLKYNFTHTGVRRLEDLLIEYGGNPVRSLIVSTWRSGSGFLGELINVMSGTYYHYEPLMRFGITQIRGPPLSTESTRFMRSLFKCDRAAIETYIRYWKNNLDKPMFRDFNPLQNNRRLWNLCEVNSDICFNSHKVASICRLFPFQSMKVVRFRLKVAKDILEDKQLNVKVVLLVRDPRGIMEARRRFEPHCPTADCMDPEIFCKDMVSDYVVAQYLSKKYPNRFMMIRYEDLMLNLDMVGLQVVKFMRLGPSSNFREYLKLNGDMGLNVSKKSVFRWLYDLDFESIALVQDKCKAAMQLWDYKLAQNASHLKSKNFYPLQKHSVFPLPMEDRDFDGSFNM